MGSLGLTSLAVGLSLLHVEGTVADGSFAGSTGEALHMPGHLQCVHDLLERNHRQLPSGPPCATKRPTQDRKGQGIPGNGIRKGRDGARHPWSSRGRLRDTHPGDLLLALGAAGCVARVVAFGAEDGAFLLKEAAFIQHLPALAAGELLWVVIMSQCHQVPSPATGQGPHQSH